MLSHSIKSAFVCYIQKNALRSIRELSSSRTPPNGQFSRLTKRDGLLLWPLCPGKFPDNRVVSSERTVINAGVRLAEASGCAAVNELTAMTDATGVTRRRITFANARHWVQPNGPIIAEAHRQRVSSRRTDFTCPIDSTRVWLTSFWVVGLCGWRTGSQRELLAALASGTTHAWRSLVLQLSSAARAGFTVRKCRTARAVASRVGAGRRAAIANANTSST